MNASQVRDLLLEKHALVERGDHFQLLGVDRDASPAATKEAYFGLVKLLHPDRLSRGGVADLSDEANEVFRALTNAYNTLSDTARRNAYIAQLKVSAESGDSGDKKATEQDVRIFTHRGDLMLKRRAYTEAEDFFRKALEAGGDDPGIYIKLGEAIFQNPEGPEGRQQEEARRCWEKARKLSDNQSDSLYHLALYWKAKDNLEEMESLLRDALAMQPDFVDAKRELRLLLMRRRNSRNNSLLGRLFGPRKKKKKKR